MSSEAGEAALDAYIDAAARTLDLPVDPAWRPGVRAHLQATLRLAALVAAHPLADDAEPAPVFVADAADGSPDAA